MKKYRILITTALLMASVAHAETSPNAGAARAAARPEIKIAPAPPAAAISTQPGLAVTPSKFTKIVVSSTRVTAGSPLEIMVYGVGIADPVKGGCAIVMKPYDKATGKELWGGYSVLSGQAQQWPKTRTISINTAGKFLIRAEVFYNAAACGYQGPGSIPGDLTEVTVDPIPK